VRVYSFSTTSKGGEKAIRKAAQGISATKHRMEPNLLPIVELQREFYNHTNPRFGKIYNPLLPIVGWTDADNPSVDDINDTGVGQRAANPTQGAVVAAAAASPTTSMTTSRSENKPTRF
jgi:hypothetical protein